MRDERAGAEGLPPQLRHLHPSTALAAALVTTTLATTLATLAAALAALATSLATSLAALAALAARNGAARRGGWPRLRNGRWRHRLVGDWR